MQAEVGNTGIAAYYPPLSQVFVNFNKEVQPVET